MEKNINIQTYWTIYVEMVIRHPKTDVLFRLYFEVVGLKTKKVL